MVMSMEHQCQRSRLNILGGSMLDFTFNSYEDSKTGINVTWELLLKANSSNYLFIMSKSLIDISLWQIKRHLTKTATNRKYSQILITRTLMRDKRIIRNKNENCSRKQEFELSNRSFYSTGIALNGLVKRVWHNESLTVGCIEFDCIEFESNQLYK